MGHQVSAPKVVVHLGEFASLNSDEKERLRQEHPQMAFSFTEKELLHFRLEKRGKLLLEGVIRKGTDPKEEIDLLVRYEQARVTTKQLDTPNLTNEEMTSLIDQSNGLQACLKCCSSWTIIDN